MAEGRGKAQAETLRKAKAETTAHRLKPMDCTTEDVPSSVLRAGDIVLVTAGEFIPGDGEVIEGVASVDESAITGESAPVIRESGGDRSAVTGGTRVLSDEIKVRITSNPGETFLDRMIQLVEGASRQKTPNEIALNILLAGLTIIFLLAVVTLAALRHLFRRAAKHIRAGLAAGLPDSHDHRRPALGHRHRRNGSHDSAQRPGHVRARGRSRGRRGRAAARQDRHDHARQSPGHAALRRPRRRRTKISPTPRNWRRSPTKRRKGRSIVVLVKQKYGLRGRELSPHNPTFIPFTAQTRMSGVDLDGQEIRKGAADAIAKYAATHGQRVPQEIAGSGASDFQFAAARRCSSPRIATCSARFNSKTS